MARDGIPLPTGHPRATPPGQTPGVTENHPYLSGPHPRAFAHRGWHLDELAGMENSRAAFRRAVMLDADGVELDVRLSWADETDLLGAISIDCGLRRPRPVRSANQVSPWRW